MTSYSLQQIAEAVSELRFRSIKDINGKLLKNLSKSALYAKINYLKTKLELEVSAGNYIANYQEPFTREEWLNFLDIERLRRAGHLNSNKHAKSKLTNAARVLSQHKMLKEPCSALEVLEVRPARPITPTAAPSTEPTPTQEPPVDSQEPTTVPQEPTPNSVEDLEVCYYITKGEADKKSFATYSASALYFVGNYKQAQTFPKDLGEEIIAVLEKTVGNKCDELFVLQQAENNYFIVYKGQPLKIGGTTVERVGNLDNATPYKDRVAAMDAITALEILFGFTISGFSIVADIPNSDKTVTVWPPQSDLTTNQQLTTALC